MLYLGILSSLVVLATAAPNADTVKVCDYLHKTYPQYMAYDTLGTEALNSAYNASVYTQINTDYWNNQNSYQFRAACAFFPANAAQVSDVVKQLNKYPDVPFGLKSAGHQPAPGFSSTKDGVLIAFEPNLGKTVTQRTADGKHYILGPGARWGDVYQITGKNNEIVVGGRLAHIGVGGLTLGGGLSYYSAQYGLACDNIDQFEAVLANGTAVNATRTSNPDLWWALRGGGNQFAIVTRMWSQAHPAGVNGQIWGGIRAYSIDKREALFRAVTRFVRDYPDEKAAVIPVFQFGLPLNLLNAITGPIMFMFYDGPNPPADLFKDFDDVQELFSTTKTKSYYDMSQEAGGAAIVGFGNSFREITVPNLPEESMTQFFSTYWDMYYNATFINGLQDLDVQVTGFDPQPLSVRIAQASQKQGGNVYGLNPDHGDRIWIENNLLWTNPTCNDRCPQQSKELSESLLQYQKDTYGSQTATNYKSGDPSFTNFNPLFMNDIGPDQDIYSSFGPENLARLKQIKSAYDPTGFFTNRQGGFKLPA
ncbi:hypothetical protein M409DRAFT_66628 [Zasmidium cellare ATCC 36951]|uniref:FAD-binding PCMH-type domain-containing protein n=1 Tax=Zasmidium cellare ATCC 36951 TaxID=1080233 RepID=A0A6A6CKG6_ZASCE|nr:uncharacterized protein M409DRAFT_66628 [Zasmidium cellare ATCC 36951]KAF2166650.1 hypothetical protein M409DRAFT_66628 [Zasmidium cellare ATCC 36951]